MLRVCADENIKLKAALHRACGQRAVFDALRSSSLPLSSSSMDHHFEADNTKNSIASSSVVDDAVLCEVPILKVLSIASRAEVDALRQQVEELKVKTSVGVGVRGASLLSAEGIGGTPTS